MVGIPPIKMVMNGGWFMTLLYQHYGGTARSFLHISLLPKFTVTVDCMNARPRWIYWGWSESIMRIPNPVPPSNRLFTFLEPQQLPNNCRLITPHLEHPESQSRLCLWGFQRQIVRGSNFVNPRNFGFSEATVWVSNVIQCLSLMPGAKICNFRGEQTSSD